MLPFIRYTRGILSRKYKNDHSKRTYSTDQLITTYNNHIYDLLVNAISNTINQPFLQAKLANWQPPVTIYIPQQAKTRMHLCSDRGVITARAFLWLLGKYSIYNHCLAEWRRPQINANWRTEDNPLPAVIWSTLTLAGPMWYSTSYWSLLMWPCPDKFTCCVRLRTTDGRRKGGGKQTTWEGACCRRNTQSLLRALTSYEWIWTDRV